MSGLARTETRKRNYSPAAKIASAKTAGTPGPQAIAEVSSYIAQLTAELSQLAGSVKLETLAYFLSMARLEAEMVARKSQLSQD